jgi:hypothetical protein
MGALVPNRCGRRSTGQTPEDEACPMLLVTIGLTATLRTLPKEQP